MKSKLKHYCDKCGKKCYTKRYAIMRHFPFYDYAGVDLCPICEDKFNIILTKFINSKNEN